MNIQIYGKNKCFDTKKAERWFKERRIKYQYVDLPRYGMGRRELENVRAAEKFYWDLNYEKEYEKPVDKSKLDEAITSAEAIDTAPYTEESAAAPRRFGRPGNKRRRNAPCARTR